MTVEVTLAVLNHFNLTLTQFEESYKKGHCDINHEEFPNQIVQMKVNLRKKEAKRATPDDITVIRPSTLTRQKTR